MPGIVIFLLIRVKMLLYFLYGTYRNGNSYKFTPFLRIYAFGNVCNGYISIFLYQFVFRNLSTPRGGKLQIKLPGL